MQNCLQTENQTIYQHGISVQDYTFQLINYLKTEITLQGWRLPEWLYSYRKQILNKLLPIDIIEDYTLYHDCGKIHCLTIDENGKRHFPNHAEFSYNTWLVAGGDQQTANLIRMDMMIHTMKPADVNEFIKHPEAITLLLVGLSELHSNAKMFGGIESESFKIKYSKLNKLGKTICNKLFKEIENAIG